MYGNSSGCMLNTASPHNCPRHDVGPAMHGVHLLTSLRLPPVGPFAIRMHGIDHGDFGPNSFGKIASC
jgi:hypothetical protein